MNFRQLIIVGLIASGFACSIPAFAQSPAATQAGPPQLTQPLKRSTEARAVEITFLKSLPCKREQLERFIRANWFAPDETAVAAGLMISDEWLDTGDDASPWNALVMVTYPNEAGFVGIKPQWDALLAEHRAKHPRVQPDGLSLAELGKIVESKKLFERAPLMVKRSKL